MENIRLCWQCLKCGDIKYSYSNEPYKLDVCYCGKSAVDLEEHYQRVIGQIKEISRSKLVNDQWIDIE